MISKIFCDCLRGCSVSSHPTAQAPKIIGSARPKAKADNSITPNQGEPMPVATPSKITNAGVHRGHMATENGMPNKNAPQTLVARFTRKLRNKEKIGV